MKTMTPSHLAILNLVRRPITSLLGVFSIALAVACGGVLLRLNDVSERRFSALGSGFDAVVGAKAGGIEILLGALAGEAEDAGFLPVKLFESLKAGATVHFEDGAQSRPSFIRSIAPFVFFGRSNSLEIVGTDESFLRSAGRSGGVSLKEGRWATGDGEVVLGSAVAGFDLGNVISFQAHAGGVLGGAFDLKVVGMLASTGSAFDRMAFSSRETARRILSGMDLSSVSIWGPDVLNYFLIDLEPGGFSELASLVNRRTVGQAILISREKEHLHELTGAGTAIGLFVSLLVLVLSGLSVAGLLVARFDAMATQIAVLRAIGWTRGAVGRWLLWEGFLLGAAACVLGSCLDLMLFPWLRGWLGSALPAPEIVPSSLLASAPVWIAALLSSVAAVAVPLIRVYRQDIHFSLRS